MKCNEIEALLTAYINEELSPSLRESIRVHLVGCPGCQAELDRFSRVGARLSQYLADKVEDINPPDYAWESLQSRLGIAGPAVRSETPFAERTSFPGRWGNASPALRLVAALGLLLLLILLTPPALTLAGRFVEWVESYYSFRMPEGSAGIGGFEAFHPYYPTELPKGYASLTMGGSTGPGWDMLELTFSNRDRFVTILQSKGLREGELPAGGAVLIQGNTGVYIPAFANSAEDLRRQFPNISITTGFDYANLDLLAWDIGEIRIELITNLQKEEALEIARSLALMEDGNGQANP